jgi:hypothetical protein
MRTFPEKPNLTKMSLYAFLAKRFIMQELRKRENDIIKEALLYFTAIY